MTSSSSDQTSAGSAAAAALPRAEHEAIQWVVRLTSGEAGADERAAFARWRAASAEHEAALRMARRLWLGLGPALPPAAAPARRRTQWPLLALAASLLVIIGLSVQVLRLQRGQGAATAGQAAAAPLEVNVAAGRCRLVLGDGEAFFDVTPNPDRLAGGPAEDTQVRMYDTAFSVRPEPAGVLVTVTGGRIGVSVGNAERVLTAGQQLRCRSGDRPLDRPDDAGSRGFSASLAPRSGDAEI